MRYRLDKIKATLVWYPEVAFESGIVWAIRSHLVSHNMISVYQEYQQVMFEEK